MASVMRPSSLASRPLRSASTRSRGCGMWVNGVPCLAHRLGGAMREHRADAAVVEAVDRALGHLERRDVVAPVDQRGDAGVDLRQRADQVGDVVVLGVVARGEIAMNVLEIIRRHPFAADAAQRRFPGMHVGVDEAGHHDLVGGVDDFVGRRRQLRPTASIRLPLEQDFPVSEVADLRSRVTSHPHRISTRFMKSLSRLGTAVGSRRLSCVTPVI